MQFTTCVGFCVHACIQAGVHGCVHGGVHGGVHGHVDAAVHCHLLCCPSLMDASPTVDFGFHLLKWIMTKIILTGALKRSITVFKDQGGMYND